MGLLIAAFLLLVAGTLAASTNEGGKTEEATTCELNNLTPASLTSIDEYFRAGKFAPRCPTVVQPNSNVTFGVQKTTWMFGLLTEYSGGLAFEMRFPNNQTDWIGIGFSDPAIGSPSSGVDFTRSAQIAYLRIRPEPQSRTTRGEMDLPVAPGQALEPHRLKLSSAGGLCRFDVQMVPSDDDEFNER